MARHDRGCNSRLHGSHACACKKKNGNSRLFTTCTGGAGPETGTRACSGGLPRQEGPERVGTGTGTLREQEQASQWQNQQAGKKPGAVPGSQGVRVQESRCGKRWPETTADPEGQSGLRVGMGKDEYKQPWRGSTGCERGWRPVSCCSR